MTDGGHFPRLFVGRQNSTFEWPSLNSVASTSPPTQYVIGTPWNELVNNRVIETWFNDGFGWVSDRKSKSFPNQTSYTSTSTGSWMLIPIPSYVGAIHLDKVSWYPSLSGLNDSSNFWNLNLSIVSPGGVSAIGNLNTGEITTGNWKVIHKDFSAAYSSGYSGIIFSFSKTGAPGAMIPNNVEAFYFLLK